jgi:hypothetical protein
MPGLVDARLLQQRAEPLPAKRDFRLTCVYPESDEFKALRGRMVATGVEKSTRTVAAARGRPADRLPFGTQA